jgi:CBS domain-containing protein
MRDRQDDPQIPERETERLALDEYDRPRYGSGPGDFTRERASHNGHIGPWHSNADSMRVHEIMTPEVTSVHPQTSVEQAARLMQECDCGALPVVGDNGVLVGIVTDRDIALRIVARGGDSRNAIIADCMTPRVFACYANELLVECMQQMARHQIRRVPIVDDRGRLVGVLSQGDLARYAAQRSPEQKQAVADVVSAVSEPTQTPYR